ncbi:MAG TPA: gliding motility-associated C-terminal domain-containing protein, partial [Bacteroidales bacterium]
GTGATATFSGLTANTYTFTVTDGVSTCTSVASLSATVNPQPATPAAPVTGTITQPTCATATGSVALSGLPAAGTWTVTESIGSTTITGTGTTGTFSGLSANTYTFTVTDGVSTCTSVSSATATVNPQPVIPTAPVIGTITQPTCASATGSVDLSGLPAGAWTVTESVGSTTITGTGATATFSGLTANTYTFTVTDGVSTCTSSASASAIINAVPATPVAPIAGTITQPTCASATGSVALSGLPAAGTWTVTESVGSTTITGTGTTATFSGLAANTYTFTVTDGVSTCTSVASGSVVINAAPVAPSAPIVGTITQPTCASATGSVALSGLPLGAWTVTESVGSTTITGTVATATFSGLGANTYTFTVTDGLTTCTSLASGNAVINIAPASAIVVIHAPAAVCSPSTVDITTAAITAGSSAGLTFTYWTDASATITYTTPSAAVNGTYYIKGSNGSGCSDIKPVTVVVNATPTVLVSNPAAVCSPSTVNLTAAAITAGSTAGLTYTYWTDAIATVPYATPSAATAGTYYIKGSIPSSGCYDIKPVIVSVNPKPTGSVTVTNAKCFEVANGSVNLTVSGGTPAYSYIWNNGAVTEDLTNVKAGVYSVVVTDANLCTENVSTTVTEPDLLVISSAKVDATCPDVPDGSITLTVTGGTQPYNAIWIDGVSTINRVNIPNGTYSVVVTDLNSCATPLDVVVGFSGTDKCIEIPGVITPNNDGFNDTWKIKNIDLFPNAEVFVFSRWGRLVFNTKNIAAHPWDGIFQGKLLPTDSYHYVLHLNDGSEPRSGVISIIR